MVRLHEWHPQSGSESCPKLHLHQGGVKFVDTVSITARSAIERGHRKDHHHPPQEIVLIAPHEAMLAVAKLRITRGTRTHQKKARQRLRGQFTHGPITK